MEFLASAKLGRNSIWLYIGGIATLILFFILGGLPLLIDASARFPDLAIDINDIEKAIYLTERLQDKNFYLACSETARENYKKYYSIDKWKSKINLE